MRGALVAVCAGGFLTLAAQSVRNPGFRVEIPKTWVGEEMATLELPLANPAASPKHVTTEYYYRMPVRPIYKSYPIYAPGREPVHYMDWLREQPPQVVWDDTGHAPPLQSETDWIKAGEIAFDAPIAIGRQLFGLTVEDVRDPAWYRKAAVPVSPEGVMPFLVYVVRKRGEVELGGFSCGTCHMRLMPDGTVLNGAQGNFPIEPAVFVWKNVPADIVRLEARIAFAAPWIQPDPLASLDRMSADELGELSRAIPAGVVGRQGTSIFYPAQTPDLIGVKERRYLDHTGLQRHRSIVDLMRYAAINQGEDLLASYAGFIPGSPPLFRDLPDAAKQSRYSDEQLYALARYIYSLQPPKNPNAFDSLAAKGKQIFQRAGCAGCHAAPLFTNNKLTLAEGFTPTQDERNKYDIVPISVGTDPNLALTTRRGTGFYKVPSLKGVWYRGPFEHNGSVATLEDWFDPNRLRREYVPTGFIGYGRKSRAVKGHKFGLDLSADDRTALVAFLKTL